MRTRSLALGLMMVLASAPAYSAVQITVDKDNQVMTVAVDLRRARSED